MTAAIFGQRRHTKISALGQRRLQEGTEKGVVDHDQGPLGAGRGDLVGKVCRQSDIRNHGRRVCWRLNQDHGHRPKLLRLSHTGAHMGRVHAIGIADRMNAKLAEVRI